MLSIAFIGCFSAFHTEVEIADYLELAGHKVDRYHAPCLNNETFVSKSEQYDIVITSLPQTFPVEFWRSIKTKKIAWYFDWIKGWSTRERDYLPRLREFDLIFSTDGFDNDIYNGLPRYWLPHACDPRVYKPSEPQNGADCLFCGHVYTPYRKRLLKGLRETFNFAWVGGNEECWGPQYSRAVNSAKIVVGDNCRNDIAGYWSDRTYLTLACGGFYLSPNVPGLERYFEDGKHLVMYRDEKDLHDKIRYFLANPIEREQIARQGAEHVAKNHSWSTRVKEFETRLSGIHQS